MLKIVINLSESEVSENIGERINKEEECEYISNTSIKSCIWNKKF